jgi:hypothetical protein
MPAVALRFGQSVASRCLPVVAGAFPWTAVTALFAGPPALYDTVMVLTPAVPDADR